MFILISAVRRLTTGAAPADPYVGAYRRVNRPGHRIWAHTLAAAAITFGLAHAPAARAGITLVALGDSLTAGYGLAPADAFPVRLEARLRAAGHDVTVINAGVSGDTTAGGLARLDWSVPADVDGVIVELGANDALRGIDPRRTAENLDQLLGALAKRKIPVLLAGMLAPRNLGSEYAGAFDPIFAHLAARHGTLHYPFFLNGVATNPALNQSDGLHPNPSGVAQIIEHILPAVEALIGRIEANASPDASLGAGPNAGANE